MRGKRISVLNYILTLKLFTIHYTRIDTYLILVEVRPKPLSSLLPTLRHYGIGISGNYFFFLSRFRTSEFDGTGRPQFVPTDPPSVGTESLGFSQTSESPFFPVYKGQYLGPLPACQVYSGADVDIVVLKDHHDRFWTGRNSTGITQLRNCDGTGLTD